MLLQIGNFLNHMAFNVDLDSVTPLQNPRTTNKPSRGADYDPMRRKLAIEED